MEISLETKGHSYSIEFYISPFLRNTINDLAIVLPYIASRDFSLSDKMRRKIIDKSYTPQTSNGKIAKKYLFWRHIEPSDRVFLNNPDICHLIERDIKVHKVFVSGKEKSILLPLARISKNGLDSFDILDRIPPGYRC